MRNQLHGFKVAFVFILLYLNLWRNDHLFDGTERSCIVKCRKNIVTDWDD